mgnify:CR=1 FL=1
MIKNLSPSRASQFKTCPRQFKYANVDSAGALSDGVEHNSTLKIFLDATNANGQNYSVNEVVTGAVSGVQATVVSWDPSET